MKVYPTNKIPQWAIRASAQGALKPENEDDQHPDMYVNKQFASVVNRHVTADKNEEEDLQIMKSASPSLKMLDGETNIKKASINSNKAIAEGQQKRTISDNLTDMTSGLVRPLRQQVDEQTSPSAYASSVPNCQSIFSERVSRNEELMNKLSSLSDASREANRQKALSKAAYYDRNKGTAEEIAEQQKARKLGEYNEVTGEYTAHFASSRQVITEQPNELYTDLFKVFTNTIPDLTGGNKNPEITSLAKDISKYQLKKLAAQNKDMKLDWREAAVNEIKVKSEEATAKSDLMAKRARNEQARVKVTPTYEEISAAVNNTKVVADTKQDNISIANKKSQSIKKTASKKEMNPSPSVKASNRVASKAMDILLDEKIKRMQQI